MHFIMQFTPFQRCPGYCIHFWSYKECEIILTCRYFEVLDKFEKKYQLGTYLGVK